MNNTSIPSVPILEARLIEEPVPAVESLMKSFEYKATEYVEAEMALETERFFNSNNEAVEAELALQIEPLMKNTDYNAKKFVEADMAIEIQSWMNNSEYWNMASK